MNLHLSSSAAFGMSLHALSYGIWMLSEAIHAAHKLGDDPLSDDERTSLEGLAFSKGERERKKANIISAWKGLPERRGIRLEIHDLVHEH